MPEVPYSPLYDYRRDDRLGRRRTLRRVGIDPDEIVVDPVTDSDEKKALCKALE